VSRALKRSVEEAEATEQAEADAAAEAAEATELKDAAGEAEATYAEDGHGLNTNEAEATGEETA
jgi:hypothetical protein